MKRRDESLDLSGLAWRKSSYSNVNGCVEVAFDGDHVAVRDSKHSNSPVLRFTQHEWKAFIDGVQDGQFSPEN